MGQPVRQILTGSPDCALAKKKAAKEDGGFSFLLHTNNEARSSHLKEDMNMDGVQRTQRQGTAAPAPVEISSLRAADASAGNGARQITDAYPRTMTTVLLEKETVRLNTAVQRSLTGQYDGPISAGMRSAGCCRS